MSVHHAIIDKTHRQPAGLAVELVSVLTWSLPRRPLWGASSLHDEMPQYTANAAISSHWGASVRPPPPLSPRAGRPRTSIKPWMSPSACQVKVARR